MEHSFEQLQCMKQREIERERDCRRSPSPPSHICKISISIESKCRCMDKFTGWTIPWGGHICLLVCVTDPPCSIIGWACSGPQSYFGGDLLEIFYLHPQFQIRQMEIWKLNDKYVEHIHKIIWVQRSRITSSFSSSEMNRLSNLLTGSKSWGQRTVASDV